MTRVTVTSDAGGVLDAVQGLYAAYLSGDPDGMVADMADDVVIRFLGEPTFTGRDRARAFFAQNNGLLTDLEFTIDRLVVDGEHAAAIWSERATTLRGESWTNHGVDVFRVVGGTVCFVHENNDVVAVRRQLH